MVIPESKRRFRGVPPLVGFIRRAPRQGRTDLVSSP
jgi:hypothetical protein